MTHLEVLIEKRNRLLSNGKNAEGSGVIRKLNRKIRKLEKKQGKILLIISLNL